nr:hypothetical protein Q903MT_gene2645 [Picea sitchensis]
MWAMDLEGMLRAMDMDLKRVRGQLPLPYSHLI